METEDRYASLSLAFRTDQQTLTERLHLHQRAKDLAEENHDKELDDLNETVGELNGYCGDEGVREIVGKLHRHLEALRLGAKHLVGKSELHGAVQQETNMSQTIETMSQHVDNLKQLYEREHSELEETRKLVDNRILQGDSELTRRSISMANATKTGKRRISTATPRLMALSASLPSEDDATLRLTPATPLSPKLRDSPMRGKATTSDNKPSIPDSAEKEEIFQKGLEQGLRISVSQELCELREQQTAFCDTLESLMDKHQGPEHEDFDYEQFDFLDKTWAYLPDWRDSLYKIRLVTAALVFGLAVLIFRYTMSLNSEVSAKKMD